MDNELLRPHCGKTHMLSLLYGHFLSLSFDSLIRYSKRDTDTPHYIVLSGLWFRLTIDWNGPRLLSFQTSIQTHSIIKIEFKSRTENAVLIVLILVEFKGYFSHLKSLFCIYALNMHYNDLYRILYYDSQFHPSDYLRQISSRNIGEIVMFHMIAEI